MTTEILLKYLHFICIFAIVASLAGEHLLLKKQMSRAEIKRLSILDAIYGIAALLLLAAGLTLWLGGVGKPTSFYSNNWIFLLKIGLFTLLGILSIYPTIFFLKERKGDAAEIVTIPASIVWLVRLELLLLLVMPLCASLMAKGIGYNA